MHNELHKIPMRITFVLPHPGLGGGTRVVATYADHLKRRGHEVVAVSTPMRRPDLRQTLRSVAKGRWWPKPEGNEPSHLDTANVPHRVLDRYRPVTDADVPDADVIVATWWEVAEWVAALTPAKGVKLHLVQGDDRDALRAIGASVERVESAFRQPLIKIAVSDWVAARLADVWTGPIRVIHNGVAARLFHASPRARQTPPRVGFVYADIRIKGMDIAIDAVRIARCECPELEVVSFGNRPPAKQFPLPEQTLYEVTPLQEKLREFYSACDAWLFPSRAEGFGLPILEAMACRTPVIGTPTGAAPELIGQGGGILVPHEDAHAMAQAILRVCRMTATEWRTMSDAAYVTAHRYTWDDATRLFEEALTRAVEQAR